MRVPEMIARKRDGLSCRSEDIRELVCEIAAGRVPDYQVAAWLMAAYLNGMTPAETVALTESVRDSGTVLEWGPGGPVSDKHSTGGVGDKVSLVLAPLAASLGLRVPMISGRTLGHTGGTLDKLESIPGMDVRIPLRRFRELVDRNGAAMSGQTGELAPADRRLYSLRDATATVGSIPLICASILGKKLAEGTGSLVFDVKCGSGAFMRSPEAASELASVLTGTAAAAGVRASALLTAMDVPLGMTAGNALEIGESLEVLGGGGPADTRELVVELTAEMLRLSGTCEGEDHAALCREALDDGSAMSRFELMVSSQGGDLEAFEELPGAPVRVEVPAPRSGTWSGFDALEVGEVVRALGGGRYRMEDEVDHRVGWEGLVPPGEEVRAGEPLCVVHAASEDDAEGALARLVAAASWDAPPGPLVLEDLR